MTAYSEAPNRFISATSGIDYAYRDLGDGPVPVDPMILPHYSYLMAGLVPPARPKIYPDSAHGFLSQHHVEFASDVDAFLS